LGAEGAVSWAKDESQSEALSKMLLSALGTAVGFKVGDLTKGQFAKMTDSYSATMKAKPTGFLTIEGPYSRSALPSTMGNMVGSGATETTSTYLQNYIDQFRLVGAAK
jgi:3-deoxy-D-arabino-heptulosonate 7-phosphate (DAHP) synthase